jgi:hypothetical protein
LSLLLLRWCSRFVCDEGVGWAVRMTRNNKASLPHFLSGFLLMPLLKIDISRFMIFFLESINSFVGSTQHPSLGTSPFFFVAVDYRMLRGTS